VLVFAKPDERLVEMVAEPVTAIVVVVVVVVVVMKGVVRVRIKERYGMGWGLRCVLRECGGHGPRGDADLFFLLCVTSVVHDCVFTPFSVLSISLTLNIHFSHNIRLPLIPPKKAAAATATADGETAATAKAAAAAAADKQRFVLK
jgi:hypothetical protein